MAATPEGDEGKLLQSALATAFTPAPTFPQQPQPEPEPESSQSTPQTVTDVAESSSSISTSDSWTVEYESHVQTWRAQSADAREKAEKERAKWEEIRASEYEGEGSGAAKGEQVETGIPVFTDPSPADARDLVTGEHEKPPAHSLNDIGDDSKASSQKWSDIPSDLASSFPSISFPSPSRPTSPSRHGRALPDTQKDKAPLTAQPPIPPPPSATLAVFDSSLSARTRVSALLSSLAINCLIPFVNGVMLGFGEIFAKNVIIGWLGWKLPGSSVANVGLNSLGRRR